MKKIGLISDTHGYLDPLVFKYFDICDEVWHAGDIGTLTVALELERFKPLRAVYGNIDGGKLRASYPKDNIFELEGVKVYMTHIGGYPGRYDKHARKVIEKENPKLFICGHSHILKVMPDRKYNMLCMNPGAAGKSGFHKMRTLLRFELADGNVQNLEAIELGKRSS